MMEVAESLEVTTSLVAMVADATMVIAAAGFGLFSLFLAFATNP
jgi:hypothetical protein